MGKRKENLRLKLRKVKVNSHGELNPTVAKYFAEEMDRLRLTQAWTQIEQDEEWKTTMIQKAYKRAQDKAKEDAKQL